jgi:hypothetical protein
MTEEATEIYKNLNQYLEQALVEYSSGDHVETLLEAKKEYFSITGQANEDDEDFESRMTSFNDWYLLQFVSKSGTRTIIKDFIKKYDIPDNFRDSLLNVNFSLFEYTGKNFGGRDVLKDIHFKRKFILPKTQDEKQQLPLIKNDLFLGRILTVNETHYLLDGICVLPKDVKPILRKESKKVRRMQDLFEDNKFLLNIEACKNKWLRYGHIDINNIFQF